MRRSLAAVYVFKKSALPELKQGQNHRARGSFSVENICLKKLYILVPKNPQSLNGLQDSFLNRSMSSPAVRNSTCAVLAVLVLNGGAPLAVLLLCTAVLAERKQYYLLGTESIIM